MLVVTIYYHEWHIWNNNKLLYMKLHNDYKPFPKKVWVDVKLSGRTPLRVAATYKSFVYAIIL